MGVEMGGSVFTTGGRVLVEKVVEIIGVKVTKLKVGTSGNAVGPAGINDLYHKAAPPHTATNPATPAVIHHKFRARLTLFVSFLVMPVFYHLASR